MACVTAMVGPAPVVGSTVQSGVVGDSNPFRHGNGVLEVILNRPGSFTVSGEGFTRTLSESSRIGLRPGQYSISAPNAVVSPSVVTVNPLLGATAHIAFPTAGIQATWLSTSDSCAVLVDGTVRCWHPSGWPDPSMAVKGLTQVSTLAGSASHECALRIDGTVWCWGSSNQYWQLGGPSQNADTRVPQQVPGIANAVAVSVGGPRSCAVLVDGSVNCWGYWPAVSDGRLPPTTVGGLPPVAQMSLSESHACATSTDADVWCWGSNGAGQLGTGTTTDSAAPVQVTGLGAVRSVSVAPEVSCAVLTDDTLWCWGNNSWNQLGTGDNKSSLVPRRAVLVPPATSISVAQSHACALLADGRSLCWGDNLGSRLGGGKDKPVNKPVEVVGGFGAVQISASAETTCARFADLTVKCWGMGYRRPRGGHEAWNAPVRAAIGATRDIAAGGSIFHGHSCTVIKGRVWCWGANRGGQLGNGNHRGSATPVKVEGITNAKSVTSGAGHSCAVLRDGSMKCWGRNGQGQLGIGSRKWSLFGLATAQPVPRLRDVLSASAGGAHTCALLKDGRVMCWGENYEGAIGQGKAKRVLAPRALPGVSTAVQVSSGDLFTVVRLANGDVMRVGYTFFKEVEPGLWRDIYTRIPETVPGIHDAVDVSAGMFACVRRSSGAVSSWGDIVGDYANKELHTGRPVTIAGWKKARDVAVGMGFACAALRGGRVQCFGAGWRGQLGNGASVSSRLVRVPVNGLRRVRTVSASGSAACAVTRSGSTYCWGDNSTGQLGVPRLRWDYRPVVV